MRILQKLSYIILLGNEAAVTSLTPTEGHCLCTPNLIDPKASAEDTAILHRYTSLHMVPASLPETLFDNESSLKWCEEGRRGATWKISTS